MNAEDANDNYNNEEIPNFRITPESIGLYGAHGARRNLLGYKEGDESEDEEE